MAEQVSFNVNAELYENQYGELAIRFPDERVYRGVGKRKGSRFHMEAARALQEKEFPEEWQEMPAHELLYGKGWHCISRMGYINGEEDRPALELEVKPEELGPQAKKYLKDALH